MRLWSTSGEYEVATWLRDLPSAGLETGLALGKDVGEVPMEAVGRLLVSQCDLAEQSVADSVAGGCAVVATLGEDVGGVDAASEGGAAVQRRRRRGHETQLEDGEEVHRPRPVPQQLPVPVRRLEPRVLVVQA